MKSGASAEQVRMDLQERNRAAGRVGSVPRQIARVLEVFSRAGLQPIRTNRANKHTQPHFTIRGKRHRMNSPFRGQLAAFATGKLTRKMKEHLKTIANSVPQAARLKHGTRKIDATVAEAGAVAELIAYNDTLSEDARGVLFWLWMDLFRDTYRNEGVRVFTDTDELIEHFLTQQDPLRKRKRDDHDDAGGPGGSNAADIAV